jgi:hypothetical protein
MYTSYMLVSGYALQITNREKVFCFENFSWNIEMNSIN